MSRENRAFDTTKLGSGYGLESHPTRPVELPPTWVLYAGLVFLLTALCFWVSRRQAHAILYLSRLHTNISRFTSDLTLLRQSQDSHAAPRSNTLQFYQMDRKASRNRYLAGRTNGLQRKKTRRRKRQRSQARRLSSHHKCQLKSQSYL